MNTMLKTFRKWQQEQYKETELFKDKNHVTEFLNSNGHKYTIPELINFESNWSDIYKEQTASYIKRRENEELLKIWTE
jgi:hypothetical protein